MSSLPALAPRASGTRTAEPLLKIHLELFDEPGVHLADLPRAFTASGVGQLHLYDLTDLYPTSGGVPHSGLTPFRKIASSAMNEAKAGGSRATMV
jgi:hypothetical protein